ncbi:MAG: RNA methyltransferase [Gammaproteobacteria bacterium]|nr:MAG: RNA methyltransferase [Gammaproteobacteria bacterium]
MTPLAERVRIVLVGPSHPGNIGAAARAMKTMGLRRLVLVAPAAFPHPEAVAMASGAEDLLERAEVHDDLAEALAPCRRVYGLSARLRALAWPQRSPERCVEEILAEDLPVALVFGRERSGLTNEELARCHALVHIPADPAYSSLNLAQAVQVMAYLLHRAEIAQTVAPVHRGAEHPPASAAQLEGFFDHLESVLYRIGFLSPERPGRILLRLRRLFLRAEPDEKEVHILRGILAGVEACCRDRRPGAGA